MTERPIPAGVVERPPIDAEVVEIPLLLLGWQMTALEQAAHEAGLTAGEMLRKVLREFINSLPHPGRSAAIVADF